MKPYMVHILYIKGPFISSCVTRDVVESYPYSVSPRNHTSPVALDRTLTLTIITWMPENLHTFSVTIVPN